MKTFVADIIPKIKRYSQKLDDLTKLTNQRWISLGDLTQTKRIFIFRSNNQLLISDSGIVEKGSWEYLENQSLLLNTKDESYLLKHAFFDQNIIAFTLDSTNSYVFFINETKYHKDLNSIDDVLKFLDDKYSKNNPTIESSNSTRRNIDGAVFNYKIVAENKSYNIAWGNYIVYKVQFNGGWIGTIYRGNSSGKYFYRDSIFSKQYYEKLEDAAHILYLHLKEKNK